MYSLRLLLYSGCNVADCDENLGHCVLGRMNNTSKCNQKTRKMWQPEGVLENSCPVETRKWDSMIQYFGI